MARITKLEMARVIIQQRRGATEKPSVFDLEVRQVAIRGKVEPLKRKYAAAVKLLSN